MRELPYTPADEKCLALLYAYQALVKALSEAGALRMDDLFRELAGAQGAAQLAGETGAAALLGAMAEQLQGLG